MLFLGLDLEAIPFAPPKDFTAEALKALLAFDEDKSLKLYFQLNLELQFELTCNIFHIEVRVAI